MLMNKMAVVFPAKIVGGHEIMTIKLIKTSFCDRKVDCYIHKCNTRLKSLLDDAGIPIFYHPIRQRSLEIIHTFINPFRLIRAVFFLLNIKNKYDSIILAQGDIELGSVFIMAAKLLNVKITSYIPYAHSFQLMGSRMSRVKDILARFVYRACNDYITISECFCRDLLKLNVKAHCSVIKNYVAPPAPIPCRERKTDDPFRLFLIGRVSFRQKGHDLLISALKSIQKTEIQTDIEVHFIGDGPDLPLLNSLCVELPLFVKPIFHGWLSDCWSIAYLADLIVIPSRYEGVPLVMLEAMSRNIPVLASNRDGMADYLSSSYGMLFELECVHSDIAVTNLKQSLLSIVNSSH